MGDIVRAAACTLMQRKSPNLSNTPLWSLLWKACKAALIQVLGDRKSSKKASASPHIVRHCLNGPEKQNLCLHLKLLHNHVKSTPDLHLRNYIAIYYFLLFMLLSRFQELVLLKSSEHFIIPVRQGISCQPRGSSTNKQLNDTFGKS